MRTFLRSIILALCCVAAATPQVEAATAGGTSITNVATATYTDMNNVSQNTTSNTVTLTVAAVSSVVTGPNETACNPKTDSILVGHNFVRTFTVTNSSNISDAYTLLAASSAGSIVSIAYSANGTTTSTLANGAAISTPLAPGQAAQVTVTVSPGTAAVGSSIEVTLTAKSGSTTAVNGQASSSAQQCAVVAGAAVFAGPGGVNTAVTKLVNGSAFTQTTPGATVSYSIAFSNTGGVPALNVLLSDTIPAGVTAIPASVLINGSTPPAGSVTLVGQVLSVRVPSLAPATPEIVTFSATVAANAQSTSATVNVASLSSDNALSTSTTAASFLAATVNVVYDGFAGQTQVINGAVVTLLDPATKQAVPLAGTPFAPNTTNTDPYTTGSTGSYGFGLGPNQIGPATYLLSVTAPGYASRQIQVVLTPGTNGLYNATLTALDGQMLAQAGGFGLTQGPVALQNIYGLFGNIPLFRAQSLTILKTVDRTFAATGDRLVYTLSFANVGTTFGATNVVDTLPPGLFYAPGTARVDELPQEPARLGRTLTWTLPTLAARHTITFATVIMPGTADYTLLTNVATLTAAAPNDPGLLLSASSSVDTRIVPGVFSDSTIITGRVYYDVEKAGYFRPRDAGIARVRIFLEDGESVLTDADGRYSFPAVRPGMHVLKLDRSTLPPNAHPYADAGYADERSTRRLVHGVFDGGLIQDINFALEGSPLP